MHPWCPLGPMTWAGAAGAREAIRDAQLDAAASLSTAARLGDRGEGVEVWRVLELVHHVAVGAERQPGVVAELAGDVDHRATLMEEQRGERCLRSYGRPCSIPAASIARVKARRRHDW